MSRKSGTSELAAAATRRERVRRVALALGLSLLGAWAIASSVAHVVVKADPSLAHALAPGNGAITAAYAEREFALRPSADSHSLAARLAREALLQDPTAVPALTVLGFQAQLRGETARSDRYLSLSWELSRRELQSQVWAIENSVQRGDVAGALHHYDVALRTSADAQTMLFPTLGAALTEPRIRSELLRMLAAKPEWGDAFIAYVATNPLEADGAVRFFSEGRRSGLEVPEQQRADFINALAAAGHTGAAWDSYKRLRPGAARGRSRDPNFSLPGARTVFDWRTGEDPGLSAAILLVQKGGVVDFAVPPSAGGVLIRQTQLLPPGTYELQGVSAGIAQPARSQPYWLLTCQDGRELGRATVPNSAENGGRFAGRFIVPRGCEQQVLALIARPSEETSGVSGQILRARLASPETPFGSR